MEHVDRLGRRRSPLQGRGLRPLFPKLPADIVTRSIRIAMSESAWRQLDAWADAAAAPTRPRGIGAVLERVLGWFADERGVAAARSGPGVSMAAEEFGAEERAARSDWLAWQAHKEQRLMGLQ